MKRITFKNNNVDSILEGRKTLTFRWRNLNIKSGEVVAAVTGRPGKPAFLTPASESFATLTIVNATAFLFGDYSEEDAKRAGFENASIAREWYRRERPLAKDSDPMFRYEFSLVQGEN